MATLQPETPQAPLTQQAIGLPGETVTALPAAMRYTCLRQKAEGRRQKLKATVPHDSRKCCKIANGRVYEK